jgi:hypothetical protein
MSVDVDEWGPCLSPGALDGGIGVSEVCEVLVLSTVLLLLMYLMYRCWSSFPGIFVFPSTSTSTHVVPAKTILISNLLVFFLAERTLLVHQEQTRICIGLAEDVFIRSRP